jgi:Zn-dependent protease with chaperone function
MPSNTESALEAGLAALKQGNYQSAIAQLEPIATSQGNGNASLQAKVGLVMAYARCGELKKAIALCQTLTESQNPQVKDWANVALTHLTKKRKTSQKPQKNHQTAADNSQTVTSKPSYSSTVPSVGLQNRYIGNNGLLNSSYTQPKEFGIYWRQAKRAKVWQPLKKPHLLPLRLLAAGSFIALFWVLREIIKFVMASINITLVKLPYLEPIQLLYRDPSQLILAVLFIAIALSPWLLDWLLAYFYNQQEFSKDILPNYSRETPRVLHRYCQQRHWPSPQLRILPIAAPIAFTYGNLPRNARIVVSQGLLEQLADEEIATIYAAQLGQITNKDFVLMSLVLLITLPIYQLYRQIATWADKFSTGSFHWPFTIASSLVYLLWCVLTGTALLYSRLRPYNSDRLAAEVTGNPNALHTCIIKN